MAAGRNNRGVAELLVSQGADVNAKDKVRIAINNLNCLHRDGIPYLSPAISTQLLSNLI